MQDEEKAKLSPCKKLLFDCRQEILKVQDRNLEENVWENKRRQCFHYRGFSPIEVENRRNLEHNIKDEVTGKNPKNFTFQILGFRIPDINLY